jgi:hypothetical protein
MMDISVPYYEDLTRISNSNIGWFLQKGPAYLHKMLTDPPPEEKSSVLERGTMIHEYILQPEEFQKDYVVWDKPKPSSPQQEEFCHALAESLEIEPNKAVLDAYKKAYSTVGKSEDKMLSEGLKIASTLKDYIDFLKSNDNRVMINPWDVKMLEKVKNEIISHKLAANIIWPRGISGRYTLDCPITTIMYDNFIGDPAEVTFHEFHINWEYPVIYDIDIGQHETERSEYTIKCKSLLDGLTLDFKNKIATIYDLKTTQKLWHFEDSIDQYDYLRQLAYYMMAVKWYLKNECDEDPDKWEYRFYIIGIDTTGFNEIRVFEAEQYMVESRLLRIHNAITDIGWHQMNNKWDHSRAYYEGDGSETLNL